VFCLEPQVENSCFILLYFRPDFNPSIDLAIFMEAPYFWAEIEIRLSIKLRARLINDTVVYAYSLQSLDWKCETFQEFLLLHSHS